jgi:hypothetical protein
VKRKYREAMRGKARERDAIEARDWHEEFVAKHETNAGTVSAERKQDVHSTRSSAGIQTSRPVQHS